jgi:hypothetical protein
MRREKDKAEGMLIFPLPYIIIEFAGCIKTEVCRILIDPDLKNNEKDRCGCYEKIRTAL